MSGALTVLGAIAFLLFSIAQIYAGYVGIDYHLGAVWAFVAIFLALGLRFTLPITIGAFFGAMDVWHWHWALAVLFAAPGLAFGISGVLAAIISSIKKIAEFYPTPSSTVTSWTLKPLAPEYASSA